MLVIRQKKLFPFFLGVFWWGVTPALGQTVVTQRVLYVYNDFDVISTLFSSLASTNTVATAPERAAHSVLLDMLC